MNPEIQRRKQYHSSVKLAYSLNLEEELLPKSFLKTIPPSTAHGWKHHFNAESLCGNEFAKRIDNNLSEASSFLALSNDFDRKMIFAVLYVKRFLVKTLSKSGFQKLLRDNKEKTIRFVQWLDQKTAIGKTNILRYIGLGRKTICSWKRQLLHACHTATFGLCLKQHPNQATKDEIAVMKKLLADPSKAHWGIASIQGWAIKQGLCFLSVASWYRYNHLFGIRKSISRFKKENYKPLRASSVNEIWHADITVFKTLDGIKNYIYTVKDNFSRKTLVWKITGCVCAQTRLETILKALNFAFADGNGSVRLITDGGPENDNHTIQDFIVNAQVDIQHQIALRDIVQSNSMVEASYRCLKSHFLYGKQIHNTKELEKFIGFYFHEHDFIKPHAAHKIYTPDEVYNGADVGISLTPLYQLAAQKRRLVNKNSGCGGC